MSHEFAGRPNVEIDPLLHFKPFPPGDPVPEIWRVIRELGDPAVLAESAKVVLDAHVAVAKLQRQIASKRVEGLTRLAEVVGRASG
jgi:hypothetical protein